MAPTSVADRSARPLTTSETTPAGPLEDRIVDALADCIGRWGIGKTTADDIARSAGVSRATLYRAFPGGKDVVLDALLRRETGRFFESVAGRLAEVETLEDTVVIGLVEAARFLQGHAPLQYLLTHERDRLLPSSAVDGLDRVFTIATAFTLPHLRPYIADDQAAAAGADWLVRQFFSYALVPSVSVDLTDEAAVRRFARTYILPALDAAPPTVTHQES